MGSGASSVGVPTNPRVQHSITLQKKEQKKVLVDAPVLVDIDHGSIRYREDEEKKAPSRALKGKEMPFEKHEKDGKPLDKKEHYFYHARLNDYGPESRKEKEDQFKFYYVMQGPKSAMHKKVFYVYGEGWNAMDGSRVKPTETVGQGKDYAWSSSRNPNSLYYVLTFCDSKIEPVSEEDKLLDDLESTPNKSKLLLHLTSKDRTAAVKARVALKLLKDVKDIHIAFESKELRDEDFIGDLRPPLEEGQQGLPENFAVSLCLAQ